MSDKAKRYRTVQDGTLPWPGAAIIHIYLLDDTWVAGGDKGCVCLGHPWRNFAVHGLRLLPNGQNSIPEERPARLGEKRRMVVLDRGGERRDAMLALGSRTGRDGMHPLTGPRRRI